jgi:hypothetical protein
VLDILPDEIAEDYDYLWHTLKSAFENDPSNVLLWFEEELRQYSSSEMRLRYLCSLMIGAPGVESVFRAAKRTLLSHYQFDDYAAWFAIRLMEVLVDYTGNARLRQYRKEIAAEWELTKHTATAVFGDLLIGRILRFAFSALQPFVVENRPQTVATVAKQVRQAIPRSASPKKPTSRSAVPPQGLAALCHAPFSVVNIRELLSELGVLDPDTGYWHLGTLKGKAGKPLSAFPAAYQALVDAKLMDRLDAPGWRKLFMEEFNVYFSPRLANYAWGKGSAEFERYLRESKRWVNRQTKLKE